MAKKRLNDLYYDKRFCCDAAKQKLCFASENKAMKYARLNADRYGMHNPYYCSMCDCWHLTHYAAEEMAKSNKRIKRAQKRFAEPDGFIGLPEY